MTDQGANGKKAWAPWLTGEVALYGLILALALVVRLSGLEMRIMDVPEAEQAWQSWLLVQGKAPPGQYSPLLLTGQALIFLLFGAGDGTARLLPALAGSALAVLPFLLRRRLGRVGSLVAAVGLALSPTLVYASRYGDGAMLLAASALAVVALWLAYQESGRPRYLYAIAVTGALGCLSDPRVVSVLIVLALIWAVWRLLSRQTQPEAQERALPAADAPDLPSKATVSWKRMGLFFGGTLLLGATGFMFNPGGLGVWADFPSAWARHLAPVVNGQPWHYPLLALALYEPFVLFLGVIGAVTAALRRDRIAVLGCMAMGLLIAALIAGGRGAGDVALLCAPLGLLAGRTVEDLVQSWWKGARWWREGLFVLVVLVILVYVGLQAAFYARSLYLNMPQAAQFLWFWLLALALLVVLFGFSLSWFGWDVTWRTGAAVLVVACLLVSFAAMAGLNFRHANDVRELHVMSAPDIGVRDLLRVMADLSYRQRGYPTSIAVTVEAKLGSLFPWYLRNWEQVTFVEELTPEVTTPVVVSSVEQANPTLGDRYMGQDFVTRTWWQPTQLAANDRWSWWLYRNSVQKPVPIQKAILWIKAQDQVAGTP